MKKYVIGLDIGTTSTKAVIFNKGGNVVSEHEVEYPLFQPQPTYAEQDPEQIEKAAIHAIYQAVQEIDQNELIGVGISTAMHSIICVDEDGVPLSPSITWADGRSAEQAARLKSNEGLDIYLKTGTPIHPMSPFLKLVWMRENNYEAYKKAAKFVSIKEFLLFKWFGKWVVDYSVAAATGLFNIHHFSWEPDALKIAGISDNNLSTVVPPTYVLEGVDQSIANKMGINRKLPFVVGASDGPLANLGIGAIEKGEAAVTIGTSGAIRQMIKKPTLDKNQEVFCYTFTDQLWVMGGPINNGGIVLRWLKELFGEQNEQILTNLASKVNPGSNGLLFLPYLNGERAPFWDANARGSFIGLSLSHRKEHLLRASLEGVIYSMYHVGEALERLADKPTKLLASGGFARSELWLQILSDVFGSDVQVPDSHQSSAWGAAWVALYSLNEVSTLTDIKKSIPMKLNVSPVPVHQKEYEILYHIFKDAYQSLRSHNHALSAYQRKIK